MAAVSKVSYRVLDRTAPKRAVDRQVARVASEVQRGAQARTPVRSGRLRAGWMVQKTDVARYQVSNPVPYARFVEHGTLHMAPEPMLGPVLLSARQRYGR